MVEYFHFRRFLLYISLTFYSICGIILYVKYKISSFYTLFMSDIALLYQTNYTKGEHLWTKEWMKFKV